MKLKMILLVLIVAAGIFLRIAGHPVERRTPDEAVYKNYAVIISEEGLAGSRALTRTYNENREAWIYPPPIRIGYSCLLAGAMRVSGSFDYISCVYVSKIFSIAAFLLTALIALRFFGVWAAIFAAAFMCSSPMELAISQRVWSDGVFGALALVLIYIVCKIMKGPGRYLYYGLFAIAGLLLFTVKESCVIVYGLSALWVVYYLAVKRRSAREAALFMLFAIAGAAAGIIVVSVCAGGILPMADVIKNNMMSVRMNAYAVTYQTGPWHYYLTGFFMLSPVVVYMAAVGIIFFSRTSGIARFLAFFVVSFILAAGIPEHLKNLRYASAVYGPMYIMAGIGMARSMEMIKVRVSRYVYAAVSLLVVGIILLTIFSDYSVFHRIFIENGVGDIVNKAIWKYLSN